MSSWILPKDLSTIPPLPGVLSKHSQNPGHSVPAPSPCGTTQSCPEGKSIFSAACAQWWAVYTLHLGKAAIARSNFPSHAKLWHHYVSKRMEKPCRCKAGTESSHPPHLTKSRTHKSSSWPCSQASLDSLGGQKLGGWKLPKLPSPSSSQSREEEREPHRYMVSLAQLSRGILLCLFPI